MAADAWVKIGWHRDLYGKPIRDILSVTPPAAWLTEAIKAEPTAQGVHAVDRPDGAMLSVEATLLRLRVELFDAKSLWADIVVDASIATAGTPAEVKRLHTRGKITAWSGSELEAFDALSRAEDFENSLRRQPAAAEQRPRASCASTASSGVGSGNSDWRFPEILTTCSLSASVPVGSSRPRCLVRMEGPSSRSHRPRSSTRSTMA